MPAHGGLGLGEPTLEHACQPSAQPVDATAKPGPSERAAVGCQRWHFGAPHLPRWRPLDAVFAPPQGFSLAAWWQANTARFEADLTTTTVTPCLPEGWAEVQVPIEPVAHAAHQMLRLGDGAEVLAPPALRHAVQAAGRAIAALYARPA